MKKQILVNKDSYGKMFVERYTFAEGDSEFFEVEHDLFCYTLSGYGIMEIEKYGYNVEQGTGIFVPKGAEFTLTNTSDVALALVIFGTK